MHGVKAKTGRSLIGRAGKEEVQRAWCGQSEVPGEAGCWGRWKLLDHREGIALARGSLLPF